MKKFLVLIVTLVLVTATFTLKFPQSTAVQRFSFGTAKVT